MKILIILVLALLEVYVNAQDKNRIDSVLNAFLNKNVLSDAHIGIQLYDIESRNNLLDYNSQKLFVPASIQKLFTAVTSLELLSSDFRFKTNVLYSGEIDNITKTINGNIYIVCSGDPSLQSSYFLKYNFINDLKKVLLNKGVNKVSGRLILLNENDYQVNSSWLWGDIGNYYGSGVSNFCFRDNTIEVYFNSSDSIGGPTTISKVFPNNRNVKIQNNVLSGESNRDLAYGYGGPYDSIRTIIGEIPRSKKNFKVKISMHNPSSYLQQELKEFLYFENKIIETGEQLDTLLLYQSPSLLDLLNHVNYKSNNNYTEHILVKTMMQFDSLSTIETAPVSMNDYWTNKLQLKRLFFTVDACGLSRKNLISPEIMNRLLIFVYSNNNIKSDFISTLPKAGVSGTLKYLGRGSSIENQFIGKSGSMDGVKCYSGYFIKNNSSYAFTIMLNNFSCTSLMAKKSIVELMDGIYENL